MPFERVHNLRDLGGIATADGRRICSGRLYRSAGLSAATHSDIATLTRDLGIRTVIDLRTPEERALFGAVSPAFEQLIEVPLLHQDHVDRGMSWSRLSDSYYDYLKNREVGVRIVETLTLLADESTLPALLCCSAGKDRTGLVTAALLAALDVPDETIVLDYGVSRDFLPALYQSWAEHPSSTITDLLATHGPLLDAPPEEMALLLQLVAQEYGSLRAYLMAHGAAPEMFIDVQRTFLDAKRVATRPDVHLTH